jgi:hypothetical protein
MARRSTAALETAKPNFGATIAERAYYRAEKRGFAPGYELEDWLAAEREIAMLEAAAATDTVPLRAAESAPTNRSPSRRKAGSTIKKIK